MTTLRMIMEHKFQKCVIEIQHDGDWNKTACELTSAMAVAKDAIDHNYSDKEKKKGKVKATDHTDYDENTAEPKEKPPTEKQMNMLRRLLVNEQRLQSVFTATQASNIISRIKGNPDNGIVADKYYAEEVRQPLVFDQKGRPIYNLDKWLIEDFTQEINKEIIKEAEELF